MVEIHYFGVTSKLNLGKMSYKLTKQELRIIAETKKEGEELQQREEKEMENNDVNGKKKIQKERRTRVFLSILIFIVVFILLAVLMRFFVTVIS